MKNGIFDNMKFPTYEYREFPKWIYPEGRDPVLAHNEDEETALLSPPKRGPGRPPKVSSE